MSETDEQEKIGSAQWTVAALVIAFAGGVFLYRWLVDKNLGHSAMMFLGIPVLLAIPLALAPKTKTVTGGILRGITLALLIIAPLVGEGYLCILFASPLFYVIGLLIGRFADYQREKRKTVVSCVVLVLLPMCLEGVVPELTFPRGQTVEVMRVVRAPEGDVENALASGFRIETPLPAFLRIGFPRPLAAHGKGLDAGAMRTIHFAGAEDDPPGDLVMRVAESRPGYVRFATVSDDSKLTQWVRWDDSEVEWHTVDATHTRVTWRVHFERQLDPAWYFAPWEHFAVREAAKYLIAANAMPAQRMQ